MGGIGVSRRNILILIARGVKRKKNMKYVVSVKDH